MRTLKLVCAAALLGGSLFATAAFAMPVAPLSSDAVSNTENVRWVCNYYGRCWWRPNYYYGGYGAYAYYPHRPYYGWRYRR